MTTQSRVEDEVSYILDKAICDLAAEIGDVELPGESVEDAELRDHIRDACDRERAKMLHPSNFRKRSEAN